MRTLRAITGRSDGRTPGKHALMLAIFLQEVYAANRHPSIDSVNPYDLSAGSGVVPEGLSWEHNCSPGIAAFTARLSTKPWHIGLFEVAPNQFGLLLDSLNRELPRLGYEGRDASWTYGKHVTLQAVNASGGAAPVNGIGKRDSVLVTNDPNSIMTWPMRASFVEEVTARTPWFRSISTLGCNVNGISRHNVATRAGWWEHIGVHVASLHGHHDLLLARIERDASKWAYLVDESDHWLKKTERAALKAFANEGLSLDMASYRQDPDGFERIQRQLFMTAKERKADELCHA